MPLYEYECDDCGHRFEKIQKFSDAPIATCPACGGRVRKLPSSPAIQFKGSGWYITDYARAGKSDAGKSDEGKSDEGKSATAKSGEAASSESSTESSPKSAESTSDSKADSKTSKPESAAPAASATKST